MFSRVPDKRYEKKCRYCKEIIDKKATVCPYCRKKQSEGCLSLFVTAFFIFGVLFFFVAVASTDGIERTTTMTITSQDGTQSSVTLTKSQENALKSAKSYTSLMAFSAKRLVEQLEFEGYPHDDAVFAVTYCGADWNEQAYKSAKSYLSTMSFSRKGLIEQLEFEGFTAEQAEYALQALGY